MDSFYQFRLPVEFEADAAGGQVLPIDAERITREINRVGPFCFDPHYLAFNQVKLVEVDESGKGIDRKGDGGFTWSQRTGTCRRVAGKAKEDDSRHPGTVSPDAVHEFGWRQVSGLAYEPIFPPGLRSGNTSIA
ncbi:MAG: hypothetical protein Ct9H300mP1_28920 [Planctomycetaceae bacterium]|nr:MAG: hypothetical protein Ct9H300mP1_28920 [Planctomycetaceae bacterium]